MLSAPVFCRGCCPWAWDYAGDEKDQGTEEHTAIVAYYGRRTLHEGVPIYP